MNISKLLLTCPIFLSHLDASELSFDGTQYLKIDIPEGSKTQAEDVQLRFRTPRPGGLLLTTTTDKATTFLALGLEGGRLKIVINLGNKNKVRLIFTPLLYILKSQ